MIWHDRAPAAPVPALSNRRPECPDVEIAYVCAFRAGDDSAGAAGLQKHISVQA